MRAVVVLCVIAVCQSVYSAEFKEPAEIFEKCKAETGFKGSSFEDIKTEGADKDDKCFVKCAMETKGILKKDGTLDLDAAKAYAVARKIPKEMADKLEKTFEECNKEVKVDTSDMCETAHKFFICKKSKLGLVKKN